MLRAERRMSAAPAAPAGQGAWRIAGALAVTEAVSWGIVHYAFAVFLLPMQQELGWPVSQITGAFALAVLVSAAAGVAVGRHLDRHGPRAVMTAGSSLGVVLVLAWSQVEGLAALYAVFAGLGLVMATVLYEPAFVVLAKAFPDTRRRRRAMTAVTLVGALASFVFLPVGQALIDAHGWRDALVVLAVVLGAITVPLHGLVLPAGPWASPPAAAARAARSGEVLRSREFWTLSAAYVLGSAAAVAALIHAIPLLVQRGATPGFAAFAVGLAGLSQIPGRVLYGALAGRVPGARPVRPSSASSPSAWRCSRRCPRGARRSPVWCWSAWATAWRPWLGRRRWPTATAPRTTARSPASRAASPRRHARSLRWPQRSTPRRSVCRPCSGRWRWWRRSPPGWPMTQSARAGGRHGRGGARPCRRPAGRERPTRPTAAARARPGGRRRSRTWPAAPGRRWCRSRRPCRSARSRSSGRRWSSRS
ncbi:MAG TPA: MFS transporter [Baekduia sp.]|nr:MFS transporter [Baekduia sp.]